MTGIGSYAFENCSSLTSIIIPEGVTDIYGLAFNGCNSLKSVVLPKSLKNIYGKVFANCTELIDVYCYTEELLSSVDPSAFEGSYPEYITLHVPENSLEAYKAADVWKEFGKIVAITNQPSSIDSGIYTSGDTEITWEYTSDGELKFEGVGCIPDIDNAPWKNYQSEIKKVTIGEGITSINYNAFYYFSNLTSITIPESVTSIGSYAFSGCEKLNSVYISSIESWCNINYGGASSLPLCSSHNGKVYLNGTLLTNLIIPNTITTLYQYTFSGFSDLFSVVIPESVITVSPALFAYCSSLREVRILGQIQNIQPQAFMNCSNLESFICYSIVPPAFIEASVTLPSGSEAFFGVSLNECTLYVPEESIDAYKAAYKWNEFGAILPIPKEIEILDTQEAFTQDKDEDYANISYTRNFTNTAWQSLYVPFEIPVTEDLLADFEIADLNDIRQYDRNDDGVKDETVVEAFKVKSGATLAANYPYLIRAKEAGEKTITVTDATLFAAEEVSIDCSSIREKFTFTGTYSRKEANELGGCYALCDGVWQPLAADATLGAFRVYLKIESRNSNEVPAQAIRIRVIGEDDATAIDEMESSANGQQLTVVYDLQGRRIVNADNLKGVYIINGKKVVK